QWSLADDEPDPGADEEEGPQAPRLDREVPVDEAGLDGEGHRAEEDEHDPPAEEPAVDAHGPQGTPRPSVRVLASRASCPPRSAGSSAGPSAALRPRWRSGTVPPNDRRRSMRLSEWRALAKPRESMSQKVVDVIEPVLRTLGADDDPHVWVAWGDDPAARYTVLAPTPPGLAVAAVRVNVPQEGPRVAAKLVRWSRVQLS